MNDLLLGDIPRQHLALRKVDRLLTGFLAELHAWRFQEDWEDVRQTVLLKLVEVCKKGQLHDMKAFVAYVRTTTRRAFFDLVAEREIHAVNVTEQVFNGRGKGISEGTMDDFSAIHAAVDGLPDKLKTVVDAIYIKDLKYAAAARLSRIPLGTLKRHLQQALKQLRTRLNELDDVAVPQRPCATREMIIDPISLDPRSLINDVCTDVHPSDVTTDPPSCR